MMNSSFGIIQKNDKFVVTKNGEPISLPKSDGQNKITSFDTREDAQRYLDILNSLSKQKKHKTSNIKH